MTKLTLISPVDGQVIADRAVFVNRCGYLDPALCWIGSKDTERGVSLSKPGYNSVAKPKSYHLKKG